MGCSCKQCDCQDKRYCYLIETRLRALACVFDKVGDGTFPISAIGEDNPLRNFDEVLYTVCKFKKLDKINPKDPSSADLLLNFYTVPGTMEDDKAYVFANLETSYPLDFIPSGSVVQPGDNWLDAVVCIPLSEETSPCLRCNPIPIKVKAICGVNSDVNDLSNYSAIAQNFRYALDVLGC